MQSQRRTHENNAVQTRGGFCCFLATATGYGTVGLKNGQPFVEVKSGRVEVRTIKT